MKGSVKRDFLDKIFDSSLDAIIITDEKGYLIEANKAFIELIGYKKKEILNKHMSEFSPMKEGTYISSTGELVKIDKKFSDYIKSSMYKFIEKGVLHNAMGFQLRKDGKVVPVEDNMVFIVGNKGERIGAFAVIRDITKQKQVEDELRTSRDYSDNIIESSLDSIVVVDKSGLLTKVNNAFLQLTGFSREEVLKKYMFEFSPLSEGTYESTTGDLVQIDEEFPNQLVTNMKLFQEKGSIQNSISFILRKDNKIVPVEDSMSYFCDKNGKRIGAVANIRDITQRKKSEEALLESEEKYRSLVSNIAIGVSLISPNMEILALNNQMQQWFPKVNVSKKPICYKTFNNPPRERVCSYCPTFKTLKDGQIHESITDTPRGDKTIHYRIISSPLKDKEGKITSAIEMVEDITEQMIAQKKLQESEEKYYNLIEHANDAIVSVNSAGRIIGFNKSAEEMFGYSREEILGKPAQFLIVQEVREKQKTLLNKLIATGVKQHRDKSLVEGRGVRKDGKQFSVEFSYYIISIKEEAVITTIIRDISERKNVEQRLLDYQQQLKTLASQITLNEERERRFFANYLHDQIGQQLFSAKIRLDSLKSKLSSKENVNALKDVLDTIKETIDNTRNLTSNISPPILYQHGLEAALDWIVEDINKKFNVSVIFKDDKLKKPIDDDLKIFLFQAVRELLANAIKHANAENVEVSIRRNDAHIQVDVYDDGVGFTVSDNLSPKHKPQGYGLFNISERLEQFCGQLEIKSQPNCGTHITLIAPLRNST